MFVYFVKGMSLAPPLGKSGVSGYSTGGRALIFFFGSSLGSPCSLLDSFSSDCDPILLGCYSCTWCQTCILWVGWWPCKAGEHGCWSFVSTMSYLERKQKITGDVCNVVKIKFSCWESDFNHAHVAGFFPFYLNKVFPWRKSTYKNFLTIYCQSFSLQLCCYLIIAPGGKLHILTCQSNAKIVWHLGIYSESP